MSVVGHGIPVDEWRCVRVPEGWTAELIGGEVVVTSTPATGHAIIATLLAQALDNGQVPDGFIVTTSAVEWEIGIEQRLLAAAPQPDIVVMARTDVERLTQPPLLAVEVLSPSDRRLLDRSELTRIEAKRLDYAAGGLADYLEVDRGDGVLRVHRYELHAGELRVVDAPVSNEPIGKRGTLSTTRPFPYTVNAQDLLP